jgi:hypothetical protein
MMKEATMTSYLMRRCVSAVLILTVCASALVVLAEEPITPIGMLLVNPSAFHRKLLKIEGIAEKVRPYAMYDVTSVCGASFKVTDDTGTIEVSFRQRCQVGKERATFVNEGSRVIVEGTMEAPSNVVRNPDGKENEFAIFARSVVMVPGGK